MCSHRHHRHPLSCILPPYLVDQIVANGTPQQRAEALQTQAVDHTMRALRLAAQSTKVAPQRQASGMVVTTQELRRSIYTANHTQTLPGVLVRGEGQPPSGDVEVDEAYDGLGATYDFYADVFERNSIDDARMALLATVHFGRNYDNAFWNSTQMVFGDGDTQIFQRFTIALDVIGHELTHGVTEDEAQLQYFNQSGALNESMSDVFGSLIKQYKLQQTTDQADWLIGQGLLTAKVHGVALRSMKEPGSAYDDPLLGTDPQPKHMNHYVKTFEDNGGVHINSGIPNHAFYQVAMALGGHAWDKAGRIWYETLRDSRLKPNTGFKRFAQITSDVAGRLYGLMGTERQSVKEGWARVGIAI